MIEDKVRWNEKYKTLSLPSHVTPLIKKYLHTVNGIQALDIACGAGRNSNFLLENSLHVDAVDISDEALALVDAKANKIEADLDTYILEKNRYDVIINVNFLSRRLFSEIKEALIDGGIVMFQTFVHTNEEGFKMPSNEAYLLKTNELLQAFNGFEIIYYEEYIDENIRGEKVKIAALVARK